MIKCLLLLTAIVASWAGGLRAEMLCGRGPSTPLDHPCAAAPKAAISAAVLKYRDEWMRLLGVGKVELATSKSGSDEIWVHVDLHFEESGRSQIPASLDGVPVVILPGFPPGPEIGDFVSQSRSGSPEADEAADRLNQAKREASEKSYSLALHKHGERWLELPGVLGIGPSKCDDDGCDFGSVGIIVQRQLLDATRSKIPSSVKGVPIVLIPQDRYLPSE